MTGLTDHTIRVWERRYSAVVAERADNGRRQYSEQDVEKLGLLKRLRPDRLLRKETDILMKGEVTLEIAGHTFLIPVEDRQSWRLQSFLNF